MTIEKYDDLKRFVGSKNNFADDLINMGYAKGRADERAKTIDELINELKHRATTIYETGYECHEYSDDELDEIAEQMKGVRNDD